MDYGAAGYQIDICSPRRKRALVSVAWCPVLRKTAGVLTGLDADVINDQALTVLVREFLERHGLWTYETQLLNVTYTVIRDLEVAIATKDWARARHAWELLAPHHTATLIASNPLLEHVATVLRRKDTTRADEHSTAIH